MHIKFLAHGKGSGLQAVNYLLSETDHKGKVRSRVTVLRGNPEYVATVVDSLEFANRYTSGVIAWGPADNPGKEAISSVLDDFEKLAFSGLEPERYSWTAIQHDEINGGSHVHVIVARVDLWTGQSLNIAPPGWQKDFDSLRDLHNLRHGWARPDDPKRARLYQPGISVFNNQIDAKKEITEYLTRFIVAGIVRDREGVKKKLSEIGQITREGKDYISVKPEGFKRAVRLKGGIYHAEFHSGASVDLGRENQGRTEEDRADCGSRIRKIEERFESSVAKRTEYNTARYGAGRPNSQNKYSKVRTGRFTDKAVCAVAYDRSAFAAHSVVCAGDFREQINNSKRVERDSRVAREEHRASKRNINFGASKEANNKSTDKDGKQGHSNDRNGEDRCNCKGESYVLGLSKKLKQTGIIHESRGTVGTKKANEVNDDGDRQSIIGSINEFSKRIRQGHRRIASAYGRLQDSHRRLDQASRQLGKRGSELHKSGGIIVRTVVKKLRKLVNFKQVEQALRRKTTKIVDRGSLER